MRTFSFEKKKEVPACGSVLETRNSQTYRSDEACLRIHRKNQRCSSKTSIYNNLQSFLAGVCRASFSQDRGGILPIRRDEKLSRYVPVNEKVHQVIFKHPLHPAQQCW
jgi:hypothetical protein